MRCQWRIRSTPSGTIQVSKLKSLKLVWWHWFAEKYKNSEAEVWKRSWTTMAKSVTRLSQESRCQQWLISWIRNKNKLTSPTWNLWWMSFLLTWKVSKCTARKLSSACPTGRVRFKIGKGRLFKMLSKLQITTCHCMQLALKLAWWCVICLYSRYVSCAAYVSFLYSMSVLTLLF